MRNSKFILTILASAALTLLAGCASYKFGTTLPPHLRTIYVDTFKNKTKEPQLDTKITSEIIREFQRDGQLKVRDANHADIILTGIVTQYTLDPQRSKRDNPKATLEYKAIVTVTLVAAERKTGKNITTQGVTGSKIFEVKGDLMTARRNIQPEIFREVARKVVDAVIGAW